MFSCEICDEKFSSKEKLDEHAQHHLDGEPEMESNQAGQNGEEENDKEEAEFSKESLQIECLDEQMDEQMEDVNPLAEVEAKPEIHLYSCTQCDAGFDTQGMFTKHMQEHDVKPYTCDVCGNGFTQNGSLKQHMFIHTGERPYKCDICGRGFTQSKSLTFHMRRHTGEKPFQCEQCDLSFRVRDALKVGARNCFEIVNECS